MHHEDRFKLLRNNKKAWLKEQQYLLKPTAQPTLVIQTFSYITGVTNNKSGAQWKEKTLTRSIWSGTDQSCRGCPFQWTDCRIWSTFADGSSRFACCSQSCNRQKIQVRQEAAINLTHEAASNTSNWPQMPFAYSFFVRTQSWGLIKGTV